MIRNTFFTIITSLFVSACYNKASSVQDHPGNFQDALTWQKSRQVQLNKLLNLPDAEKILGEPAFLSDSSSYYKKNAIAFQCAFKAKTADAKTSKTGAVYFLVENFDSVTGAQSKYTFIKKANEDHKGIKALNDLGDEAYFHSDDENFYFIMVRKGRLVFNMKVNKITSKTSLEEFNKVSKQITDEL